MHALIIDGTIIAEGRLPNSAKHPDTGEWVTPPDGEWTPEQAARVGWFRITDTERLHWSSLVAPYPLPN